MTGPSTGRSRELRTLVLVTALSVGEARLRAGVAATADMISPPLAIIRLIAR
jgi:hypothetical protein